MTRPNDKSKSFSPKMTQITALTALGLAALATKATAQGQEDVRALSKLEGIDTYELRDDGSRNTAHISFVCKTCGNRHLVAHLLKLRVGLGLDLRRTDAACTHDYQRSGQDQFQNIHGH